MRCHQYTVSAAGKLGDHWAMMTETHSRLPTAISKTVYEEEPTKGRAIPTCTVLNHEEDTAVHRTLNILKLGRIFPFAMNFLSHTPSRSYQ